jgi:hypothetical protein
MMARIVTFPKMTLVMQVSVSGPRGWGTKKAAPRRLSNFNRFRQR